MTEDNIITITTTFNGKERSFHCPVVEFLPTISKFYKIDSSKFELYVVKEKKTKISVWDLEDLMKVELKVKGNMPENENHDSLETLDDETLTKCIKKNLEENHPLSYAERTFLLDLIKNTKEKKRKHAENDCICPQHGLIMNSEDSGRKIKRRASHSTELIIDSTVGDEPNRSFKDVYTQTIWDNATLKRSRCSTSTKNLSMDDKNVMLIKKLSKTHKNSKELEKLMETTFSDRRRFIVTNFPPVLLLKELYPPLFSFNGVKKELDRIFYEGKSKEFLDNITKFARFILEESGENSNIYKETESICGACFSMKQKEYVRIVGSIFAANMMVKDPVHFIVTKDNPGRTDQYPYINAGKKTSHELFSNDADVKFNIMVESVPLCEVDSFPEAILCYTASFFIFNISYPDSLVHTLLMFEKLYLQPDEAHESACHDNFVDQLIKLIKLKAER